MITDITGLSEPPVPFVLTEDVALAPSVSYTTPPPVTEHMPAPVIEYIASPPVEFFSFVQSAHWSHRRLVNPQIYISAEETSQMQVIVQSTTEIPVAEWIQEHSTVADLVNPQLSITTNEVWEVVDSFPLLEDNQIHQEQIVTRVQPHVIVHKNSSASN